MYDRVDVTANLTVVIECKLGAVFKINNGCWGTSKNYEIENGLKSRKMDLKLEKHQYLRFSHEKYNIIAVFWLYV